jgi:hypothetical protein
LATGALAARKECNFILWALAAGLLGLVILAFLPFANRKGDGPARRAELKKKGDTIAAVLTILGLFAAALWLTVGKGA